MACPMESYRFLFRAYVLAALGTGVAVVALSLLAFDLAGDEQGSAAVIGTALSIKTLAYVIGAPVAAAMLSGLARRPLLVALDLVRAAALLLLPLVTAAWQLYTLIALFTLASAAFTPAYQATVPALLPDPSDYAKSLSRSRLVGELEGVVSPLIAAGLLAAVSLRGVFLATMSAFLISALLIARTRLPAAREHHRARRGLGLGFAVLFTDPALRMLVPLALAAGAGTAVAMVETVPLVRGRFGLGAEEAAFALAVFGGGAVAGALALPRVLGLVPAATVMLTGGAAVSVALAAAITIKLFITLLAFWAIIGLSVTLTQAPALAVIRDAVAVGDRQRVYAAHVSITTAAAGICFAITGAISTMSALADATAALAAIAAAATLGAASLWRPRRPA